MALMARLVGHSRDTQGLGLCWVSGVGQSGAASVGILRGWVSGGGCGRPGRDRARSGGLV